jgi:CRP-like cAMP-binding protein
MTDGRPLIRKLEAVEPLTEDEIERAIALCRSVKIVEKRTDIISAGEQPEHVHIVLDGWAARYSVRANGSRQFTAFLIPGDFCDIQVMSLDQLDHGIMALTDCVVAFVEKQEMEDISRSTPGISRALQRSTLIDEAILRRWIVNVTSGDALSTVAHLLCEMHVRLRAVDLVDGDAFNLPLTQEELAEATGMTAVHMNRTLTRLRQEGLIELQDRKLLIMDVEALRELCGFDPNYLHLSAADTLP